MQSMGLMRVRAKMRISLRRFPSLSFLPCFFFFAISIVTELLQRIAQRCSSVGVLPPFAFDVSTDKLISSLGGKLYELGASIHSVVVVVSSSFTHIVEPFQYSEVVSLKSYKQCVQILALQVWKSRKRESQVKELSGIKGNLNYVIASIFSSTPSQ